MISRLAAQNIREHST